MEKTEGTGKFIYRDNPIGSASVTWRLIEGNLSDQGSWRVEITLVNPTYSQPVGILQALEQNFVFKFETDDGAVFPCGISSLDEFNEDFADWCSLEICSRDLPMESLKTL